jgi:hypothetical protein
MQHSSTHHHQGILAGIFLALAVAAVGFFMQLDLVKAGPTGGRIFILAAAFLAAMGLVLLRSKHR